MKIGIDAKWYFEGPPSGKRVVRSLVDHILEKEDGHEYFLFLDRKQSKEKFPAALRANVHVCYVWAQNNLLSNLFVLPFLSRKYRLDAVLYQNFISPLDRSRKVAYIHDVLFLSNPEYYTLTERLYFAPLKFLTKRADSIITVSEEEKKRLLHFGFSEKEEKITVAYHGVDPDFAPIENHSAAQIRIVKLKYHLPDRFLLFVGRLNLRKNIDNLLRAVPLLKDKTIPLVIVGADDWKRANHEQIIQELGLEGRVIFTGAIFEDLPKVYSLASVFCFPSYAESFGLPPLEAMACGVPVVVSRTTSLPEVCGPAAEYITPDNPLEIAGAIDKLLAEAPLHAERRRLGIQQAAKFNWHNTASIVRDCLERSI